jgi:Rod binding domain-containing protein
MTPPSITMAAASLEVAAAPKPSKAEDAARQFEGLLIAQMLRSARESGGLSDDETDSESSTMFDVAGQQFAQMLAQQGGIGLTRLVAEGLTGDAVGIPHADGAAVRQKGH